MELTWEQAKKEIDHYIVLYLQKIEWYYGDNRAPFAYPPRLYINRKTGDTPAYVCELVLEFSDSHNIIIEEKTPSLLFQRTKEVINSRFIDFDSRVKEKKENNFTI